MDQIEPLTLHLGANSVEINTSETVTYFMGSFEQRYQIIFNVSSSHQVEFEVIQDNATIHKKSETPIQGANRSIVLSGGSNYTMTFFSNITEEYTLGVEIQELSSLPNSDYAHAKVISSENTTLTDYGENHLLYIEVSSSKSWRKLVFVGTDLIRFYNLQQPNDWKYYVNSPVISSQDLRIAYLRPGYTGPIDLQLTSDFYVANFTLRIVPIEVPHSEDKNPYFLSLGSETKFRMVHSGLPYFVKVDTPIVTHVYSFTYTVQNLFKVKMYEVSESWNKSYYESSGRSYSGLSNIFYIFIGTEEPANITLILEDWGKRQTTPFDSYTLKLGANKGFQQGPLNDFWYEYIGNKSVVYRLTLNHSSEVNLDMEVFDIGFNYINQSYSLDNPSSVTIHGYDFIYVAIVSPSMDDFGNFTLFLEEVTMPEVDLSSTSIISNSMVSTSISSDTYVPSSVTSSFKEPPLQLKTPFWPVPITLVILISTKKRRRT